MFEDVDEVVKAGRTWRHRKCKFGTWLDALAPKDASRAEELVADRTYSAQELASYFGTKGFEVNFQVLSRHRNGICCRNRG